MAILSRRLGKGFLIIVLLSILFPVTIKAQVPVTLTAEIHVENIGWTNPEEIQSEKIFGTTGQHLKLEGIKFHSSDPESYRLKVRSHSENIGWQDFVNSGELSGSTGLNSGIEAIIITPEGTNIDQYQLYYRVHIENFGWSNWAKQNEIAGTTANNVQIEAIQLQIVPKEVTPQLIAGDVSWAYNTNKNVRFEDIMHLTGIYPHDKSSFIEGFSFYNGQLYESSGRYGNSNVYKNIDLNTNKAELIQKVDDQYFGEGSVVFHDKLYLLTYKERKALVYNPETLELIEEFEYPDREGWGLTTDGTNLIASDGSDHIYFMDENLKDQKVLDITLDGKSIDNINELEYIDGYIWANIWHTYNIIIIDPDSGDVVRQIDFTGLYQGDGEVMNGIAFNPESRKVYLTGKWWETMYEFDFNPYYNYY